MMPNPHAMTTTPSARPARWPNQLTASLFVGGAVFAVAAAVWRHQGWLDTDFFIWSLNSALCVVGAMNVVVWRRILRHRSASQTPGNRIGQTIFFVAVLAALSVLAVAVLMYVALCLFFALLA